LIIFHSSIRDNSILEIAIPGSHDSFTYYLDKTAPFSQNSDALEQIFDELNLDLVDSIAKEITYNWAVTVHMTTIQQLRAGIRYLDYRTMPHKLKI
jgi:hypothetical protein